MTKKKNPGPLGLDIRDAREAAELKQSELAELADVPRGPRGVSSIEHDEAHVKSWRLIERIRRVLKM